MNTYIYVHGFNSTKNSLTAKYLGSVLFPETVLTIGWISDDSFEKNLDRLIKQVERINSDNIVFIGTSMGGFWASHLSKIFNTPAVLFNPVVDPVKTLSKFKGHNVLYETNESYELSEETINTYLGAEDVRDTGNQIKVFTGELDMIVPSIDVVNYWKNFANVTKISDMEHRVSDFSRFKNEITSIANKVAI